MSPATLLAEAIAAGDKHHLPHALGKRQARQSRQSGARHPSWSGRSPHSGAHILQRWYESSRGPQNSTESTSNG